MKYDNKSRLQELKEIFIESGLLAHCWFWLWLCIVFILSSLLYFLIFEILGSVVKTNLIPEQIADVTETNWIYWGFVVIGWILFSWRVIKVVVLHASPISFGWTIADGIHKDSGRHGTFVRIEGKRTKPNEGDKTTTFWVGVVLRAHPSSDKLARSRLEFLILSMPLGRSLLITESRWKLRKAGHEERQSFFNKRMAKYLKTTEFVPPDKFRRELLNHIKSISTDISKKCNRIDGLHWINCLDRSGGIIVDDFGYQLEFEQEEDCYLVVVDSVQNKTLSFNNVTELRAYAKSTLNPT